MKKLILVVLSASLSLVACKKDDSLPDPNNNNNNNNNTSSTLTVGSWKMVSSMSVIEYPAPVGTQTVDLFVLMQPCVQDNLYIFNANNTTTSDEGATKCNASDPQQKTAGTWALINNNTKLQITENSTSVTADILTLNSSTLELRYVTTYGGMNSTTTTKYTH
jgi:hypothetical protein